MIYFDNAATSFPKPAQVIDAVGKCLQGYAGNPGRSGHELALEAGRAVFSAREKLAQFFNIADPMQVIFTLNATDALNLALHGFLQAGDRVVTTSMEHNSVLRPLADLRQRGVTHEIVWADPRGEIALDDLRRAISKKTNLVVVNHASNVCGTVQPIREIGAMCRQLGIPFLVDASQSAGQLTIDVEQDRIDLLAAAGHKSLLGPQGTGFLYIRPGIEIAPLRQGGTGSRSEDTFQPEIMPDRYESGTLNTPGIVGLAAGLDFINQETQGKIVAHEKNLIDTLLAGLSEIDGLVLYGPRQDKGRAAVVAFGIGDLDSGEIAHLLGQKGICCRPGLHCAPLAHQSIGSFETGAVRLSPGFFNTLEEIEAAIRMCWQISRTIRTH